MYCSVQALVSAPSTTTKGLLTNHFVFSDIIPKLLKKYLVFFNNIIMHEKKNATEQTKRILVII